MTATQAQHRRRFAIYSFVTVLYWVTLYIYVPILSPYMEAKGIGYTLAGIVLGSYGLVQIFVRLPIGVWSDRLRVRRPFVVLGLASGAVSCLLFAAGAHWGWTLAARAVGGFSASCWVAYTVLFASYYDKNDTTRAMGHISTLTVVGQLIGMGLSGWIAGVWGWTATFWTGLAIGTFGAICAFAVYEPREGVEREPIRPSELKAVMRLPILLKASLLSILGHSVLFITMFGFTPLQAVKLGATPGQLSLLVFAFMIPHAAAASVTSRWIVPRIGVWGSVITGFALSAVCTLAISLMPTFGGLAATQIVNGFAQGMHLPLLLGLAIRHVEPRLRATAMGFYQAVYAIGMFAGPFVAGIISKAAGLAGGFYLGSALGLAAAGIGLYWSARERRSAKAAASVSL
ncbi:MAG: MFS transporter [Paenibacillaceae bacterium]|nr:MFS transporter [Paenibacillaceae bacterium]